MDGSNNQLFQSYGRRKRSNPYLLDYVGGNGTHFDNFTGSSNNGVIKEDSQEKLSAIIRVLAEGEDAAMASEERIDSPEQSFLHRSESDIFSPRVFGALLIGFSGENLIQLETHISDEMMCIAEGSFIAIIVTASLLCVLFSSIIVAWGCSKLRGANGKGMSAKSVTSTEDSSTLRKTTGVLPAMLS